MMERFDFDKARSGKWLIVILLPSATTFVVAQFKKIMHHHGANGGYQRG